MEMARFEEPVDVFALESWNGCDIYENEEYRIMDNGDIVLDEFETMQEWIEAHSTLKKAAKVGE